MQSRHSGRVVISTNYSGHIGVSLQSITNLETRDPLSITLTSGEQIIGHIDSFANGKIQISSATLGKHVIPVASIATINPVGQAGNNNLSDQSPDNLKLSQYRGKGTGTDNTADTPKPIGRPADEEDLRKLFVRQSSIVLAPGQYEVEVGLQYQRSRFNSTVLNSLSRSLTLPIGLRTGLAAGWQGYVNVPLTYGYQQYSFDTDESSLHRTGVGDITAGVNYQLVREGNGWPDLVATAGLSAPTGRSPYADDGSGVALGTGHWAANVGLQFVKTEDPVAIFGGVGYTHHFARNGLGKRMQPGGSFGYNLGLSFAINDRVSISGEFIGSAQRATREDGVRVVGTDSEPMQFRTGLIYRIDKAWYLAPTLTYKLNNDAPDVVLGVSSSHRFQ